MKEYYAYAYLDFGGVVQASDTLRLPIGWDGPWVQQALDGLIEHVHTDANGTTRTRGVVVPVLVQERGA